MTSIAIMQPYFFPYLGYFCLLPKIDIFVMFDCVQFPRRGWVHRNKFTKLNDTIDWLTLPIQKCHQTTLIKDLAFDKGVRESDFKRSLDNTKVSKLWDQDLNQSLFNLKMNPVDLLEHQLKWTFEYFNFTPKVIRSSQMSIDTRLKGSARIIEISKILGAKCYVNLSGGLSLYSREEFDAHSLKLSILEPFKGSNINVLERILTEPKSLLIQEIIHNSYTM